jgi:hypothetical protein
MMSDFRNAARGLRRSPALVIVAVLSLVLGIGVNVTVFSVVREMILDNLSARRPEQLARVEGVALSWAGYRELRLAGSFEDLAFYRGLGDRVWSAAGEAKLSGPFPPAPTSSTYSAFLPPADGYIHRPTRAASSLF